MITSSKSPRKLKRRNKISSHGESGSESRESLKSTKLNVSFSSMFLRNFERPEVIKIDRKSSIKRSTRSTLPFASKEANPFPTSGIPEDAAVHFGNFYCLEKNLKNNGAGIRDARTNKFELPVHDQPRSEFTRQMVHKLERLAGTEYYARQISALLEETVEPPDYVIRQPPDDNFFPYERSDPLTYPLWYKNPDKMNYRSSINESTSSMRESEANGSTNAIELEDSATSECTLINTRDNIDLGSIDYIYRDSNSDAVSILSKITLNSMENCSNSEDIKINVFIP